MFQFFSFLYPPTRRGLGVHKKLGGAQPVQLVPTDINWLKGCPALCSVLLNSETGGVSRELLLPGDWLDVTPTMGGVSKQLCGSACQVKPQHGFHLKTISYADSLAAEWHLGINHSLSRNLISDFFRLSIFLLPVNITNFRTRIIAALIDILITISEL